MFEGHRDQGRASDAMDSSEFKIGCRDLTNRVIRDKVPYRELGDQYLDAQHREHVIRHHVRRLESLGLHIDMRELPLTG
jgi:hypothetical protein